ncbi:MAG: phenylalanine--tRNA ligase subunit alpha [Phycisphaerales bacterium]
MTTTMIDTLGALESDGLASLDEANDADGLEAWRIEYLGTKGRLKKAMAGMREVPKEEKPAVGQRANAVKETLEAAYESKKATLGAGSGSGARRSGPMLDVTLPGVDLGLGRRHILSRVMDDLAEVFARMGFRVAEGPEVEDEWHNFVALNIPEDHPARDPLENFYIDGKHLLRTQTSTVQIRAMENTPPPIRVVSMGRVYRPDEVDATHSFMFHQIEGLYVDRNVSVVDLKTTLLQFAHAYFGAEAEVRLVPSFFPFTEPSAELYIKMQVKGEWQWVELGGCGMVDPNVFEAVGYDPEEWTGFAFGLGIERIAMRKYNIPDIRWFFENDLRFLRKF